MAFKDDSKAYRFVRSRQAPRFSAVDMAALVLVQPGSALYHHVIVIDMCHHRCAELFTSRD